MINGKNIVVTGASSGIGKSILEELLEQGDNRILAACRRAEMIADYGDRVIPFSCDLSTKEGVDALFDRAEEVFDKIDIFFCNAGAPYYERFDYEDWDRVQRIFDLNTVGHIYTYSKYLHHLDGREGRLVYTISAMGEMALPGYALYAATKFAMKGFQQAIRDETPKNLQISCVYPVSTKTNFFNVGGGGRKMEPPFPVQAPEKVGKAVVKGIDKFKKHIYPCPVYLPSKVLMKAVPPVKALYVQAQKGKLRRFVKRVEAEKEGIIENVKLEHEIRK
ncbi:MAG: SDR family NAD(P)-dependent oxidoreductase [Oscillospiraceae bacterium]|nr:SDR family NAD(P)-dependent oxidoreductase [Oscillospiraceae bacterium]